jgi:hypothetical protein
MAINNGYMRGIRVTGFKQFRDGGFAILGEPFNEEFEGDLQFLGLVTGHFSFGYTLPEGTEAERVYAVCTDELLVYEPRITAGPVSMSGCIAQLGGSGGVGGGGPIWGLALALGERDPNSPVTLPDFPPCSPLPWVFFKPSGGGPFTIGRGQGAWEGNVFISRA